MQRIIAASIAVIAALGSVLLAAPDARAATPTYVALGDSYASGNGAGSYLSDGTGCYRSPKGYPGVIASSTGLALTLEACSGATTDDVLTRQLGSLTGDTGYVSVTVGGNDIGFASTITTCMGTNTTACLNAVTAAESAATSVLPARLDALFTAVKSKATTARVVVTNYPRLFNGKDCSWLTSFTSTEMTRLNNGANKLSDVIAAAAGRAGITFVDVRTPFQGHAVCDRSPWIHNASLFRSYESFHANASGYSSGYTPGVKTALAPVTSASAGTLTVTTGKQTSSDTTRGHVKVTTPRG
ncbi:MAG: SGNH/GDSL hydrolase family protein [Actinomycetes bacterium]